MEFPAALSPPLKAQQLLHQLAALPVRRRLRVDQREVVARDLDHLHRCPRGAGGRQRRPRTGSWARCRPPARGPRRSGTSSGTALMGSAYLWRLGYFPDEPPSRLLTAPLLRSSHSACGQVEQPGLADHAGQVHGLAVEVPQDLPVRVGRPEPGKPVPAGRPDGEVPAGGVPQRHHTGEVQVRALRRRRAACRFRRARPRTCAASRRRCRPGGIPGSRPPCRARPGPWRAARPVLRRTASASSRHG